MIPGAEALLRKLIRDDKAAAAAAAAAQNPWKKARGSKDEDVPETIRGRARQMASVLGIDAVGDVDELIESMRAAQAAGRPAGRRPQ